MVSVNSSMLQAESSTVPHIYRAHTHVQAKEPGCTHPNIIYGVKLRMPLRYARAQFMYALWHSETPNNNASDQQFVTPSVQSVI